MRTRIIALLAGELLLNLWWMTDAVAQSSTVAVAAPARIRFDISSQNLEDGLNRFALQSRQDVLFSPDIAVAKRSVALKGEYDTATGLRLLLAGTGLTFRHSDERTILIEVERSESTTGMPVSFAHASLNDGARLAQVEGSQASAQGQGGSNQKNVMSADSSEQLEEIVVTGTNIRGVRPASSPVQVLDRDAILRTGAATTQQLLQTVTANFGGGSNESLGAGSPVDANSFQNIGGGSSVNLRGLGSRSTLVLLDGKRLAPSSGIGDFVDISLIPLSALERVEILTDGASAIYGGDAVAGVVNLILRRDYQGAESAVRFGTVTDGDSEELEAHQLLGTSWGEGGAMLALEYHKRDHLSVADRAFSADTELPNDLLPAQRRVSAVVSANQRISDRVKFTGDAFYADRESDRVFTISGFTQTDESRTRQLSLSGEAEFALNREWTLEVWSGYSDLGLTLDRGGVNAGASRIDSDQWSLDGRASGPITQLPGGAARIALGTHYRMEDFSNVNVTDNIVGRDANREVAAVFAELAIPLVGAANAKPWAERIELNISGRYEHYSDFGSSANPKIGLAWAPTANLNLRANYGKSFSAPPLGQVGARDTNSAVYTNDFINSAFDFPTEVPDSSVALFVLGTSKNLKAETAKSWTAGFDYGKDLGAVSLALNATYFDINFKDRIDDPIVPGNLFNAINIQLSAPQSLQPGLVVQNPTADQVSAAIALAEQEGGAFDFFGFYQGPDQVGFLVNFLTANNARTIARGIDLGARLGHSIGAGELSASFNASYLIDLKKQAAVTSPEVDVVDTVFNPTNFKGRAELAWTASRWNAVLAVNHTDSYTDDRSGAKIGSWSTFDALLGLHSAEASDAGLLSGFRANLMISNLFDKDPPTIQGNSNFLIWAYDPTNASPLGRLVSLQLIKRW